MRLARIAASTALVLSMAPLATASAVDHGKGSPGYCPDGTGVTVVVDFQELGGDTIVRCAPGGQASGLTALQNAGLELTGVQRWGLGFICRIEGKPGADTEACIDTPPATAYWAYWHAPNGGSWTYSQLGVMNRKPPPGSFEGWSFAKNKSAGNNPAPRIGPVRPNQAVEPPPPAEQQNGAIPGRDGVPAAPPAPEEAVPPPAEAPPSEAPTSSAAPTSAPALVATPPPSPSPVGGVAPGGVAWTGGEALPSTRDSGFPWGAVLGGAAVLLVGGAAGVTAYRRKRAS
ncbi:ABC transporter substrate-binding protein [Amycolatopsis sp. 195334CR]|uniref:ABC transporter substrate-binding protein n=1 Tax=Amycolatopsis sp. 195334CR TaxID=2814588 RepID=UPI001A90AB36|nr:ABC transporter substrate-binding protein [Amycolatopsis sp. 195334CR]MBN6035914.1 ABC transporter substrate-binding protein [Amycolatopsis sp. 195334CR]